MGAGSSAEQRGPEPPPPDSAAPAEPEPRDPAAATAPAAPDPAGDPAAAAAEPAAKLLQKNGQLSTANGCAVPGEPGPQEGAGDGPEGEVLATEGEVVTTEGEVVAPDVGHRESEDGSDKGSDGETATHSAVAEDTTKDDQEEVPEVIEQIRSSDSNVDELTPPAESQTSDVGFRKVFKFVGFKFTVKKDKTEKSDAVQLLTVKKDDEAEGAKDHQEPGVETGEVTARESDMTQSAARPQDTLGCEPSCADCPLTSQTGQVSEEDKDEGEEKPEKEPVRSAESPTGPVPGDTASPFRKFFSHGWAGWRKKTSFKKPKEEDVDASERKEQESGQADGEEKAPGAVPSELPPPAEAAEGAGEAGAPAGAPAALPGDSPSGGPRAPPAEGCAPLATEVFDEKAEVRHEVVADVHARASEKTEEPGAEDGGTGPPDARGAAGADTPDAKPAPEQGAAEAAGDPGGDPLGPAGLGPEEKAPCGPPEGAASGADVLAAQERARVQGSPLKKLFSSSGLKKLSGKRQKGRRGGGGSGEPGEPSHAPAESPDSGEEPRGESSASSPEEPEDAPGLERGGAEGPPDGEAEEGAASDGERRRDGVTPWASFKKMVTPKKRARRPSESDREDEEGLRGKSATLSSADSAVGEPQEDARGAEEPKPEEPKRRVDTSVSWEALICVGSSKKRARRASSSSDEGAPGAEAAGDEDALAGAQDREPGPGGSSPEAAGSPAEGDGVSTWASLKRLVTPRKRSRSKVEERAEDAGAEPSAADAEPGREESWASIRKLIPGRRRRRPDGKQEQAAVGGAGPLEVAEEDPDVPAVVPLAEYDALEKEKMEARQVPQREDEHEPEPEPPAAGDEPRAVVDGTRAAAGAEERSPSWISASVTEPLQQAEEEAVPPTEAVEVTVGDTPEVTLPLPESRDAPSDPLAGGKEATSEAVTGAGAPTAFCAEEATEASGAEETTEMVSAVSQLTESPDTTQEATPVQEAAGGMPDAEEQERRTQAVLRAVAEKVTEGTWLPADTCRPKDGAQTVTEAGLQVPETVQEVEEDSEGPRLKGQAFLQVTASVDSAPPGPAEALTDSETDGSTPVADVQALPGTVQQGEVLASQEETVGTAGPPPHVPEAETEAAPSQEEEPPASPNAQSQEPATPAGVVEQSDEAVPILSNTEVTHEAVLCADEDAKDKDRPCVEALAVTPHPDSTGPQGGEEATGGECQRSSRADLEGAGPEERKGAAQVEREETEAKAAQGAEEERGLLSQELSQRPAQTGDTSLSDGGLQASSSKGSSSRPDRSGEAGCTDSRGPSSEASVTLPAAAVEHHVSEDGSDAPERAEALEAAGPKSVPAVAPAIPETGPLCDSAGETSPSPPLPPEGHGEQVGRQETREQEATDRDVQAEDDLGHLETESSKLVQNVIQTAVGCFVRTEEAASEDFPPDVQAEGHLMPSDSQGAEQKPEKEDSGCPAKVQEREQTVAAPGKSPESGASGGMMAVTAERSPEADPQYEEEVLPSHTEGGGTGTEPGADGDSAEFREGTEKSPLESKEEEEGVARELETLPSVALGDPGTSGGVTKESPDTNGPKLTEEEGAQDGGPQEGRVYGELPKEIQPHAEQAVPEQERDLALPRATAP
ncbi:A-kinase anchor protein 12 [Ctenodactylus gundi]